MVATFNDPTCCLFLQILEGAVASACREMDALHRLLNGIALLDVLQSFATMVRSVLQPICSSEMIVPSCVCCS